MNPEGRLNYFTIQFPSFGRIYSHAVCAWWGFTFIYYYILTHSYPCTVYRIEVQVYVMIP